jgi:hypothetical protein
MIDPVLSEAVWERYERDRARPGLELSEGIARLSEAGWCMDGHDPQS